MKQLCFSTASTNQEGPLQFLCLNQPFVQVDEEMNDRWDYLLADLNDEAPARHMDENLRYPELNQQRFHGQTRHTGQRMMDQRSWMPPASSGYMDIFNNHNMASDLATSGGFPGSAFVNPSIANVSGTSNVTSMLPPANHLAHTSNATRNGLPQVKTEPGYVASSQSQPMASLDLNTHVSQQQATSSAAPSLSATRFNGHSSQSLDMDDQERKKLERKRARNRAAASKCRQRKLERIQELEGQVQQERQRNAQLQTNIERAQQELRQLQTSIEEHRQAGCQISSFN